MNGQRFHAAFGSKATFGSMPPSVPCRVRRCIGLSQSDLFIETLHSAAPTILKIGGEDPAPDTARYCADPETASGCRILWNLPHLEIAV